MGHKTDKWNRSSETFVKDIERATRKQYSPEEKIRIVLDGLRGEDSIAELCRRERIPQDVYYEWPKDFMEAGKRRLPGSRQTGFTYLKVLGGSWFYLSTILDDYSRYIIAWKLCTNMRTEDVTDTLDLALQASGCDQVHVVHKPF